MPHKFERRLGRYAEYPCGTSPRESHDPDISRKQLLLPLAQHTPKACLTAANAARLHHQIEALTPQAQLCHLLLPATTRRVD